jgi:hypothetical protein
MITACRGGTFATYPHLEHGRGIHHLNKKENKKRKGKKGEVRQSESIVRLLLWPVSDVKTIRSYVPS